MVKQVFGCGAKKTIQIAKMYLVYQLVPYWDETLLIHHGIFPTQFQAREFLSQHPDRDLLGIVKWSENLTIEDILKHGEPSLQM